MKILRNSLKCVYFKLLYCQGIVYVYMCKKFMHNKYIRKNLQLFKGQIINTISNYEEDKEGFSKIGRCINGRCIFYSKAD